MHAQQIAQRLVEDAANTQQVDPKVRTVCDRILLQIASAPSLQCFLNNFTVVPDGHNRVKIQLDFLKLPKEVIPDLERLISADWFKDHQLLKYTKDSHARTGLELTLDIKDLPGSAYDYAF